MDTTVSAARTILAAVDRMISVSLFSWLEPVPVLSLSSLRIVSLLNPSSLHTQTRQTTMFGPEQESNVLIRVD